MYGDDRVLEPEEALGLVLGDEEEENTDKMGGEGQSWGDAGGSAAASVSTAPASS